MLISLTVETNGRGSHALESLTALKIITFRCKYLATMATGDDDDDDDDDDEDGATTTTTTTTATRRRRDGRWDTTAMAVDNDDNEVDGNGATSNDDGYVS